MANPATLTAKQVRAGRALLAWSQQDLAKEAGIAASTLADFERGQRTPVPNNAQAIRSALESAGISFPPGGAVVGPVPPALGPISKAGTPIRWIDITDLSQWAERRDGQGGLPSLLSKLVRASGCVSVHFPSDEAVQHPGWDGTTNAGNATEYVPEGACGWEIGTQREKIEAKANDDYEKRTENPEHLAREKSTFIFVTPRPWPKKEKWASEKRAQGIWQDVKAYDGTDLVHWIESYPAVGRWLAAYLGKRPQGSLELQEVWQEWSLATAFPLTTDLILSDRDPSSVEILSWLRSPAASLSLQGDTAEEVCAFLYATINQLPEDISEHYFARSMVASTPEMARLLADSISPLIIVLLDPQPGLAQVISNRGHHVLCAYGSNALVTNVRKLERPTREGIQIALLSAGVPQGEAENLSRASSRNLAILRRLMANQAGSIPEWAQSKPPRALLAAILAGGWDETSEADQAILARLGDAPYNTLMSEVVQYAGQYDSPIRKIGSIWKVSSPQDAWLLLAKYLTNAEITRFETASIDVLSSADPRYSMEPEERWLAPVRNVKPEHSEVLRKGLGETLIMLSLYGAHVHADAHAASYPDRIVGQVLNGADGQRWWSLCGEFQLLAEAAPDRFLKEIEHSLDQESPPISALFGSEESGIFGTEHLSDLLWALESLAWPPENLGRVCDILARLAAIDPGGRYSNRPANSLKNIFLLWLPQTHASQAQRFKVLDRLRKLHPEQAWKLMIAILPNGYDSATPAATMRWRDCKPSTEETVTYHLIGQGAREVLHRLLQDAGLDANRWKLLLDRLSDITEDDLNELIDQLSEAAKKLTSDFDRLDLWNHLRKVVSKHREFPEAEWSLPESKINCLETIYESLRPTDPVLQISWLFDQSVSLTNPSREWDENLKLVEAARTQELIRLLREHNLDTLFELAIVVQDSVALGASIARSGLEDELLSLLIERGLQSEEAKHLQMAQGAIRYKVQGVPDSWFEGIYSKAINNDWGERSILGALQSISVNNWTWQLAHDAGPSIESSYWSQVPIYGINADSSESSYVVEKLIEAGRARSAVHFIDTQNRLPSIPTELIIQLLNLAAAQPIEPGTDNNEALMFQHHVVRILKYLDSLPNVPFEQLLAIEWAYLPLLEHSQRPPKIIPKAMADIPELFIQMICAVFKPSVESGIAEEEPLNSTHAKNIATQAFNVLRVWDIVPGTLSDGSIDANALEKWVKTARKLAKARGRDVIADQKIGEVLSASPMGNDDIWPALEIRELIETVRSEHMEIGFVIGQRNRRGVTTRALRAGGIQERDLASRYYAYSKATALEWPRTSTALKEIAQGYEVEAKMHDDSVEKLDW